MAIAPAELEAQRIITDEFVKADQFSCLLMRRTRTSNGAGGFTYQWIPTLPQNLRMNPLQDAVNERITSDGRAVLPRYVLVGRYNANMERFDRFAKDGKEYEIVFIIENRQYQVKAEVHYLG